MTGESSKAVSRFKETLRRGGPWYASLYSVSVGPSKPFSMESTAG